MLKALYIYMPQLDISTYFPQVITFFLLFCFYYYFIVNKILPKVSYTLKFRKKVLVSNLKKTQNIFLLNRLSNHLMDQHFLNFNSKYLNILNNLNVYYDKLLKDLLFKLLNNDKNNKLSLKIIDELILFQKIKIKK